MASGSSSQPIKNIVLVGRTGNGKSATGNSLVRKQVFESSNHGSGVTMACNAYIAVTPDGAIINVIDTPGVFDLITDREKISKEIVRCLALAREGLHAVVLVLSARNRVTKEEEDTFFMLQKLFGVSILKYLIVVFTGGDELNNKTLDMHLTPCPPYLKNILKGCGHRKVVFDNRTENEDQKKKQIQQLLEQVAAIGINNNGIPFTPPKLQTIHHQITGEMVRFKKAEREAEAKYEGPRLERKKTKLMEIHEHKMNILENMVLKLICGSVDIIVSMIECNIM